MKIDHFWHILRTTYGYQSPSRPRFLVENLPGWATFAYYSRLVAVVLKESITARKGRYNRKAWASGSLDVFKVVEAAGGIFHVSGLSPMAAQQGPLVYIANHMSLIDTMILPCILLAFNHTIFVVKEGLLKYPLFGSIVCAVDPIAVTRRSPREDLKTVLTQGQALLASGRSVVIFPQATRSDTFDVTSFNSLGIKLARKAGVPVLPVALKTDFQQNGRFIKDLGQVDPRKPLYLKFGEPLVVEGGGRVTHQKVVEFIVKNLREWGADIKSGS